MTDTSSPIPFETSLTRRRAPARWAAATIVTALVFVGGRATVTHTERTPAKSTHAHPAPKTGTGQGTWAEDPPATSTPTPADDGSVTATIEGDTTILTGPGATGGSFSMRFPGDWIASQQDNLIVVDSPQRLNTLAIVTLPADGPFEAQATDLLDLMSAYLTDADIDELEPALVGGDEALRAGLSYLAPDGTEMAGTVVFVNDGDSVYALMGEAPLDDPGLTGDVVHALASFTTSTTS